VEADPTFLSTGEWQRRFGTHKVFVCADPDELTGTVGRLRDGTSLGTPLLLAVLATFSRSSCNLSRPEPKGGRRWGVGVPAR
jgi:hypothetical protein